MKMKNQKLKIGIVLSLFFTLILCGCPTADEEFVHDSNTIAQMMCRATKGGGSEFIADIFEFDKNEKPVLGEFTQEEVEGGYGIISFIVPATLKDEIDLKNVYLVANLSWDQFISPSLSGRHNILWDETTDEGGIYITVTSGVGTKRPYRVIGHYN